MSLRAFFKWQCWWLNSGPHTYKCSPTWATSSRFAFQFCFSDRILCLCQGGQSSYLCLPSNWDYRSAQQTWGCMTFTLAKYRKKSNASTGRDVRCGHFEKVDLGEVCTSRCSGEHLGTVSLISESDSL
jgi:hypothetical protein